MSISTCPLLNITTTKRLSIFYTWCETINMRKEIFEEGEFYHIYNRGVDQKILFNNDQEKLRFIHTIFILNNFLHIPHSLDIVSLKHKELLTPIDPYIKIVAGCIMPNHYHLLLTPLRKNGISLFMHKIGLSYSHYFNKRYKRVGRLFESTFKAKYVDRHDYLFYLTQYIHLNPVDLFRTKYGTEEILSKTKEYPWSSLPIYLNKPSPFSLLVSSDFRDEILGVSFYEYQRIINAVYNELYRT